MFYYIDNGDLQGMLPLHGVQGMESHEGGTHVMDGGTVFSIPYSAQYVTQLIGKTFGFMDLSNLTSKSGLCPVLLFEKTHGYWEKGGYSSHTWRNESIFAMHPLDKCGTPYLEENPKDRNKARIQFSGRIPRGTGEIPFVDRCLAEEMVDFFRANSGMFTGLSHKGRGRAQQTISLTCCDEGGVKDKRVFPLRNIKSVGCLVEDPRPRWTGQTFVLVMTGYLPPPGANLAKSMYERGFKSMIRVGENHFCSPVRKFFSTLSPDQIAEQIGQQYPRSLVMLTKKVLENPTRSIRQMHARESLTYC